MRLESVSSALQAFQQAIAVTSNNVANASTPGYDEESIELSAAPPQSDGTVGVGAGVVVSGSFPRLQSGRSQSATIPRRAALGSLNAMQNYTNQIDNLFGTTAGGLTTALQTYYSAWSNVANDPTSTAARQALLGDAQSLATSFQSSMHAAQRAEFRRQYAHFRRRHADQFASAQSIAQLNKQIVVGQPPPASRPIPCSISAISWSATCRSWWA